MEYNDFFAPKTMKELADALNYKKNSNNTFLVSGATDLAVTMKKNRKIDFFSIDLTKIEDMKKIEKKGEFIEIGACVTMKELEQSPIIQSEMPALSMAASRIGSVQIRNRATIGGNIANAAQCADTLPVLFSFHAEGLLFDSKEKTRLVRLEDLFVGFGHTHINDDEVLHKIIVPLEGKKNYSAFSKIGSRKTVTISKINYAIRMKIENQNITDMSIYIGSIGAKPIRALKMETYCIGKKWSLDLLEPMFELASQQIEEAIPTRSSRHYKKVAVKGITEDTFYALNRQLEVKE
jgi:CO/xanthine dehydrogenase FAD-binding subunit